MSIIFPDDVSVQGNTSLMLVTETTGITLSGPSLADEINADDSLEITGFIYGTVEPSVTENSGNAPARLLYKQQFPIPGNAVFNQIALTYAYDPQAASSDDSNSLRAAIPEGTVFYLVIRRGIDQATAWAANQYVDIWKVKAGRADPAASGTDEFAVEWISQALYPVATPTYGAKIAA